MVSHAAICLCKLAMLSLSLISASKTSQEKQQSRNNKGTTIVSEKMSVKMLNSNNSFIVWPVFQLEMQIILYYR